MQNTQLDAIPPVFQPELEHDFKSRQRMLNSVSADAPNYPLSLAMSRLSPKYPILKPSPSAPAGADTRVITEPQVQAAAWLQEMAKTLSGAILADDCGLGKTTEVCAWLAKEA